MPVCSDPNCALAGQDQPAGAFPWDRRYDRPRARCRVCNGRIERELRACRRTPAARIPATPFAAWLRETFATPNEAAMALDMHPRDMRRLMKGEALSVTVDRVDRACIARAISIDALYPPECASFDGGTNTVPRTP